MKIIWRYIFREFLVPLCYCLVGFVGIYVLFELFGSFSRMTAANLSAGEVAEYFAGYLSPFFHYLAPAALMLATIYTMWNFSRHSEITAMRASGIGPATIARPILFGALLLAAFVAWVNEGYMPDHALWAKRLRTARFKAEEAMRVGAPNFKDTRHNQSWVVAGDHDASCAHFTDVRITVVNPDGTGERVITAEKADYLDGEWWLTGARTIHYATDQSAEGEKSFMSVASPTPELEKLDFRVFPELKARPAQIQMQSDGAQYISSRAKLRFLRRNPDLTDDMRDSLMYDTWAQILSPLACLVITLLSIPAGISSGRQAVFSGVIGALVMFFAYYGLVIGCMVLAKTGLMPPVPAAFVPPVAFSVLGVYRCMRPLRPTLFLTGLYFALVAVYVGIAWLLVRKLGMDAAMAHVLAATLPVAGAAVASFRLGRGL